MSKNSNGVATDIDKNIHDCYFFVGLYDMPCNYYCSYMCQYYSHHYSVVPTPNFETLHYQINGKVITYILFINTSILIIHVQNSYNQVNFTIVSLD